jgi:hypothetical protein
MERRIPRTPVRRRHGLLSQDWAFNLSLFICFLLEFIEVIFNFIGHSHIYFEFSLGFNALHLHLRIYLGFVTFEGRYVDLFFSYFVSLC